VEGQLLVRLCAPQIVRGFVFGALCVGEFCCIAFGILFNIYIYALVGTNNK